MEKKKFDWVTLILVAIFLVGVGLLAYPSFSDYWNSFHQSRAIASYAETVAQMDDKTYEEMLAKANEYNAKLTESGMKWTMTDEDIAEYDSVLDISGTGIMGYIEIEKINCYLPIYHGTGDAVLQIAIGHIQGSSLPIGGKGTHAVLSGHRGLPSAKLFTDLDQMDIGDTFVIRVLDEIMTYEVDNVLIVEPDDLSTLTIDPEKDYVTLVTCTPYGINTHRLLVRGHRTENAEDVGNIRVTADGLKVDPIIVAPAIAAPILLFLLLWLISDTKKRRARRWFEENKETLAKEAFGTGSVAKSKKTDNVANNGPRERRRRQDRKNKRKKGR